MEAWDNLAHQVTLLAINPDTGRVRRRTDLALATAGGALAELALQDRVSLVNKKVRVHDPDRRRTRCWTPCCGCWPSRANDGQPDSGHGTEGVPEPGAG